MKQINESLIAKFISDSTEIQLDLVPKQLIENIAPVLECNPRPVKVSNFMFSAVATGTGVTTIYTTPPDEDFFLTSLTFCISKNVTCDLVQPRVTATVGGTSSGLIVMPLQTLTAESHQISTSYPYPIKLKRNSEINIEGPFAAGACSKAAAITGFIAHSSQA